MENAKLLENLMVKLELERNRALSNLKSINKEIEERQTRLVGLKNDLLELIATIKMLDFLQENLNRNN